MHLYKSSSSARKPASPSTSNPNLNQPQGSPAQPVEAQQQHSSSQFHLYKSTSGNARRASSPSVQNPNNTPQTGQPVQNAPPAKQSSSFSLYRSSTSASLGSPYSSQQYGQNKTQSQDQQNKSPYESQRQVAQKSSNNNLSNSKGGTNTDEKKESLGVIPGIDRALIQLGVSIIGKGLMLLVRTLRKKGYDGAAAFTFKLAAMIAPFWFTIVVESNLDVQEIKRKVLEQEKKRILRKKGILNANWQLPSYAKAGLAPGWVQSQDEVGGIVYTDTILNKSYPVTLPPEGNKPPLNPGWEMRRDSKGRNYFVDTVTKKTHWELPEEGKWPQMKEGWEARRTLNGKTYYCDTNTRATFWTLPEQGKLYGKELRLKKGWEQSFDPATGKPYYICHSTQQTFWECPPEAIAQEGEESNDEINPKDLEIDPDAPVDKVHPGSDGIILKLLDKCTGFMVLQMEFAGKRMSEIGLSGKVAVRGGVAIPFSLLAIQLSMFLGLPIPPNIKCMCLLKIELDCASKSVAKPGAPASKEELHDLM